MATVSVGAETSPASGLTKASAMSDQPPGASRRDLFKLSAFGLGAGATAAMFPGFASAAPGDDLPEPDTGLSYFLKLGPIKGSSRADKYKDQLEITSWDWGAANPATTGSGGGAGAGKAKPRPFKFLTRTDIHTPKAFEAMVKGTILSSVLLNVVAPEASFAAWSLTFNGCVITDYENFPGLDGGATRHRRAAVQEGHVDVHAPVA